MRHVGEGREKEMFMRKGVLRIENPKQGVREG